LVEGKGSKVKVSKGSRTLSASQSMDGLVNPVDDRVTHDLATVVKPEASDCAVGLCDETHPGLSEGLDCGSRILAGEQTNLGVEDCSKLTLEVFSTKDIGKGSLTDHNALERVHKSLATNVRQVLGCTDATVALGSLSVDCSHPPSHRLTGVSLKVVAVSCLLVLLLGRLHLLPVQLAFLKGK
jgi:hypothetical protein